MIDNTVRRRRYSGSKFDSNDWCINNGVNDCIDDDESAIECKVYGDRTSIHEGIVLVLITESPIDVDAGNDGKHEPARLNKIAGSNISNARLMPECNNSKLSLHDDAFQELKHSTIFLRILCGWRSRGNHDLVLDMMVLGRSIINCGTRYYQLWLSRRVCSAADPVSIDDGLEVS